MPFAPLTSGKAKIQHAASDFLPDTVPAPSMALLADSDPLFKADLKLASMNAQAAEVGTCALVRIRAGHTYSRFY